MCKAHILGQTQYTMSELGKQISNIIRIYGKKQQVRRYVNAVENNSKSML